MDRILNWNIQMGGGSRVSKIVENIKEKNVTTVILTEFRPGKRGEFIKNYLDKEGFNFQIQGMAENNKNSVLMASKRNFTSIYLEENIEEFQKRVVGAKFNNYNIFSWYFPQGKLRKEYLDYIYKDMEDYRDQHTFLIGDFNVGCIDSDGFYGKFRDVEERFSDVVAKKWVDCWRNDNPYIKDYSWYSTAKNGFRIDHILASPAMLSRVHSVCYSHSERLSSLSDHSQMICEVK